jgi:hypothetical protein
MVNYYQQILNAKRFMVLGLQIHCSTLYETLK